MPYFVCAPLGSILSDLLLIDSYSVQLILLPPSSNVFTIGCNFKQWFEERLKVRNRYIYLLNLSLYYSGQCGAERPPAGGVCFECLVPSRSEAEGGDAFRVRGCGAVRLHPEGWASHMSVLS